MSAFTDRFNAVLDRSVPSVAAVCRASGVDRTTIQKLKVGKRHPPRQVLEAFLEHTTIGATDRTELLRLYEIEEIGPARYHSRSSIRNLFNQAAFLDEQLKQLSSLPVSTASFVLPRQEMQLLRGFVAIDFFVSQWLADMLFSGQALRIFMPFSNEDFFRHLLHLTLFHQDASITHILNFEQHTELPENAAKNLDTLSRVLPFSFTNQKAYTPYYFYCDTSAVDDRFMAMPYYCLAENSMLLFSSDFSHMIVYRSPEIIRFYGAHFQDVLHYAQPLVTSAQQPASSIENYMENAGDVLSLSASFEAQPCLGRMFAPEVIDRYLSPDLPNRRDMLEMVTALYAPVLNSGHRFSSFFTERGIYRFASTGLLGVFPQGSALPFSPEDRIFFLQQIRSSISEGQQEFYMVRGNQLKVPDSVVCEFYEDGNILFIYHSGQTSSVVRISENSIFNAFLDFFTSLPNSELVCSREEALDVLDQCIRLIRSVSET